MADVVIAGERERCLLLRNPLIAGPGTVGYGRDVAKTLSIGSLGALTTNTTTLRPRPGSAQPRLAETPAGFMLHSGLPNPGLRTVLQRHERTWERLGAPVILSLAAASVGEFAECAHLVEERASIAGLELEPDLLAAGEDMVRVVDRVRTITALPLIVRLSPASPQALADAIVDLSAVGCDAVVFGDRWPGLVMDNATGKPLLSGGVQGPAIRPLALHLLFDVAQRLGPERIPLIGCGGVSTPADVAAFLAAGAAAVQLDAVVYSDPAAVAGMTRAVDNLS